MRGLLFQRRDQAGPVELGDIVVEAGLPAALDRRRRDQRGQPDDRHLVQMLVDNHRLPLLPEIATQFEELKNAREGAADVLIVSAFPLEGAQLNELVAGLERKFKRKLKPTVEVDSSLIGGVRVTVGDEVLDTSVRARLASMQTALTA